MRLRSFFTVPTEQKITDKYLRRVLISSICSILLCLSCLAGATWAWFSVSIENKGNEIWIGEPNVEMKINGADAVSATVLPAGEHLIQLEHANQPDDLNKKSTLYVTFTIFSHDEAVIRYITLNETNQYRAEYRFLTDSECEFSWTVSWFRPANASELTGEVVEAPTEAPTEPTTEATDPTDDPEESTEADSEEPTGDDSEEPNGGGSEEPTGNDPEEPTGNDPEEPTGNDPEEPTGDDPEEPTGDDPEEPTGDDPEEPTGEDATDSSADNPEEPNNT